MRGLSADPEDGKSSKFGRFETLASRIVMSGVMSPEDGSYGTVSERSGPPGPSPESIASSESGSGIRLDCREPAPLVSPMSSAGRD